MDRLTAKPMHARLRVGSTHLVVCMGVENVQAESLFTRAYCSRTTNSCTLEIGLNLANSPRYNSRG